MTKLLVGSCMLLFFFVTGCAKWDELVERRVRKNHYDEFAEMSDKEIYAFNEDSDNEDKILCKVEKPTGSLIPVRICHWESVAKKRTADDQRAVEDFTRSIPQSRGPG